MCVCLTSVVESTLAAHVAQLDKYAEGEGRPKKLIWRTSSDALQMAVWVSPSRPIVFGLIRNASRRKIHYCDYLLGNSVEVYARQSPSSDWTEVPEIPVQNPTYIGALRCGANDTLYPGERMKPSRTAYSRNEIKGDHTFEVNLDEYNFPNNWQGTIECKIIQRIFGGRHKDTYSGKVESTSFTLKLPLNKRSDSR